MVGLSGGDEYRRTRLVGHTWGGGGGEGGGGGMRMEEDDWDDFSTLILMHRIHTTNASIFLF